MASKRRPYRLAPKPDLLRMAVNEALKTGDEDVSVTSAPAIEGGRLRHLRSPRVIYGDKNQPRPSIRRKRSERAWLRWLAVLAQKTDEQINSEKWEYSLREFALFGGGDQQEIIPDFDDFPALVGESGRSLARLLRDGVRAFLDQGEWETPALGLRLWTFPGMKQVPEMTPVGSPQDVIIFSAARLLSAYGDLLHRCEAKNCGKPFVSKTQRATYCSPKCRDRTKFENFIKRQGGMEAYSQYRAKMRRDRLKRERLKRWQAQTKPAPS